MLTSDSLADIDGVRHGFFTRDGGVSEGVYAGLNCGFGSGDDPERVAVNRARAAAAIGVQPPALVTVHQVHGTEVITVEAPWSPTQAPRADGMATRRPGIALGILAADCAPILFADPEAGVIGAAHAGWKGALAGIAEATIAAMARLGARAERIHAAIGPCIAQASYEVGPEFPRPFLAADPGAAGLFEPAQKPGHHRFDLAGYVARRLQGAGIATVARVAADTCLEEARFFSYRRACLRGERDYGRGLSAIALEG